MSSTRIIGFDLARAYAIFGMYIVNFNIVFGNYHDPSPLGRFLSLFSGNSSTVFVILAGMGISLMTNRPQYTPDEKRRLQTIVHKRGVFLVVAGLLLYLWWPADILHFYGGYMHVAALLLFVNKRLYLWTALAVVIVFHVLLGVNPYQTGWDFTTLTYQDFWTVTGFLRNTLYNGWNAFFPWFAYFLLGMYLGRLNWTDRQLQRKVFAIGLLVYSITTGVQWLAVRLAMPEDLRFFLTADYLPPFLPFLVSTSGFALMLITAFMYLGQHVAEKPWAVSLAATGRMTLTHYISHLTLGMLLLAWLTGQSYVGRVSSQAAATPLSILLFSVGYFAASCYLSKVWTKRFKNGPFETLMRKVSG
jgi:uncharacterized membrane protein YeiB